MVSRATFERENGELLSNAVLTIIVMIMAADVMKAGWLARSLVGRRRRNNNTSEQL